MAPGRIRPDVLLQEALLGKDYDRIVQTLVSCLQRSNYSVNDFFRDAAGVKERIAATKKPVRQLLESWTQLDRTMSDCLAIASVGHEKFIETTLHAFCEIDAAGTVVYANGKMLELDPNCLGQELATRFGRGMADEVRQQLKSKKHSLQQLNLDADGQAHPVLAEFGTFKSDGRAGGFAFLVDMKAAVEAEHRALEAAPYGMLKLDSKHRVVYANRNLLELLELSLEDVVGRDSRDFIHDVRSRQEATRQFAERRRGRGGEYELSLTRSKSKDTIRLRVVSSPSYDTSGQFSGMLASIVQIDLEIARNAIAKLVATQTDYRILFKGITNIVRKFIPFDWADLSLYTPERDFALSFCQDYPPDAPPFNVRWWKILPSQRGFIELPCPCVSDLKTFLEQTPEGSELLRQDPELRRAIEQGRKAIVAFPVRQEGRITGALSLQSKSAGIYNADTLAVMQKLALDQALQAVFIAREQAEQAFISKLLRKISDAVDHTALAETIVSEIGKFYDFPHVSIVKINALRGYFSILAQYNKKPGTEIPKGYTQPIDEGLLGLTYRRAKCVNLGDRADGSEEAKVFKKVSEDINSELCIPIKLRGRLLWILNVEDPRRNAFNQPEVETLLRVVAHIDATIDRLFQGLVLHQVLEVFPEAVVITNKTGVILQCNDKTKELFEKEDVLPDENLSGYLSEPDLMKALSEQNSLPWSTKVIGSNKTETPILLSKFHLPEEYDHVVLLLQNVNDLKWKTDAERLRAALSEAACQVRVPLSLVSSFVQQIGRKAEDVKIKDLASKTTRQLGRVELTYDRVFASYSKSELPPERKIPVDVNRVLQHILSGLPDSDRTSIAGPAYEGSAFVLADSYRLLFALESMLAYLLRSRASSDEITVGISSPDGKSIEIVMTGPVQSPDPNGELERLVEAARIDIALGEQLLKRIAAECGGTFARKKKDVREELQLRLKLMP